MNLIKQDVGVWMDVEKHLPKDGFIGTVKTNYHRVQQLRYAYKEWDTHNLMFKDEKVTHWQEPIKQVYVFTSDELEYFYNNAYTEGLSHPNRSGKTFEQFLNSITNK